jgi:arylsulfatase A-like enzyme
MDQYDRARIPLPKNYMPVHPFDNGWMTGRDEKLAPWPRTEEEIREHLHDYYAVITGLDHHIGRLLADLRHRGLYDNTLIIFSSDHGLAVGSHGLMGKQSLYEHSAKAPLIFSGPGIPRGRSDALVYLYDIYPTVCELVGAGIPDGLDAQSLAPIIAGKENRVRESLFTAYENVQRAVRDERWKLIRYPQINRTQLFDLQHDPDELRDLSAEPAQAGRIERLLAVMRDWQQRVGDDAPLTAESPKDPTFVPPSE